MDILKGTLLIVSTIGLMISAGGSAAAIFWGYSSGLILSFIGVAIATVCLVVLAVMVAISLVEDIKVWKQKRVKNV